MTRDERRQARYEHKYREDQLVETLESKLREPDSPLHRQSSSKTDGKKLSTDTQSSAFTKTSLAKSRSNRRSTPAKKSTSVNSIGSRGDGPISVDDAMDDDDDQSDFLGTISEDADDSMEAVISAINSMSVPDNVPDAHEMKTPLRRSDLFYAAATGYE